MTKRAREKMLNIILHQEVQVRSTLSSRLTPVRMARIKDKKQQVLVRMRRKAPLEHHWWECKLVRPLWRTGWGFLRK